MPSSLFSSCSVPIIAVVALRDARSTKSVFLRFPLGFFLLAQGLLIGMVALAFWLTRMQERFDGA